MKSKLKVDLYESVRPHYSSVIYDKSNIQIVRKYCLFPKDNAVTQSLIKGYVYEPYMFQFLKDNSINLKGTDVVEVGSNNGHFTVEFAELVGDNGRVYAFEPQRVIFQQLCCNIFLNGFDNVYTHQIAIGNEIGKIKFEYPNYFDLGFVNFGDVSVFNEKNAKSNLFEQVNSDILDSFEFNDVRLLKIDVQGYEENVIDGAINTIQKHRPYIIIEIEDDCLKEFGSSEEQLIEKIESLNYVVKRFQEGIPYSTTSGKCLDCVAIPKEKFESKEYIII